MGRITALQSELGSLVAEEQDLLNSQLEGGQACYTCPDCDLAHLEAHKMSCARPHALYVHVMSNAADHGRQAMCSIRCLLAPHTVGQRYGTLPTCEDLHTALTLAPFPVHHTVESTRVTLEGRRTAVAATTQELEARLAGLQEGLGQVGQCV